MKTNWDDPEFLPDFVQKMKSSGIDRRTFLMRMAILTASSALPFTQCKTNPEKSAVIGWNPKILSEKEWQILLAVQDILLPSEPESPGARELNAASYVQWVISDKELDPEERNFLKSGLTRVDDEAVERWEKPFLSMKQENQEKLLRHIETHSWGETWLSVMLLRIFEAMLSDPLYGGNTDEKGWKWLNYNPGLPRPEQNKMYGSFELDNQ